MEQQETKVSHLSLTMVTFFPRIVMISGGGDASSLEAILPWVVLNALELSRDATGEEA